MGELLKLDTGKVSPEELVEHLLEIIDDIESLAIVVNYKEDGNIQVGYSNLNAMEVIGTLQVGIADMVDGMRRDE